MSTTSKRRRINRSTYSADPLFQISESVALLEQATESNQRQIEEISLNTNKAITDLAANSARQIREVTVLVERQGTEFRSEMKSLATDFAHSRQPNYLLWLSGFMALAVLIGAAYKISDLQTQVTMSPILTRAVTNENNINSTREDADSLKVETSKLDAALGANNARDEVSEKSLETLNRRAEKSDAQQAYLDGELRVVQTKLIEVETQFKASDQARNIQFANLLRFESLLWEKAYGTRFPSEIQFYPSISTNGTMPETIRPNK